MRGSSVPNDVRISGRRVTRVSRGAYVVTREWDELFSEGRLCTRAQAAHLRMRAADGVFALATAGALHRLPLYRVRSDRVDMIFVGRHPRHSGRDVARHHLPLSADEVVTIDGMRVTSLERTVYDMVRLVSLEAAVVAFDAALRQIAWDAERNIYDEERAERFRAAVRERIAAHSGARGIRQARFVVEFADGRAQLPGESISRLWMWQLGVQSAQLQYRVDLPDGRYALLDFCWPRLGRWAEFDGRFKYTDSTVMSGRTKEQVLLDQAQRQQVVEDTMGWRCDRWGFAQMTTVDEFAAYLRSIGLLGR